MFHNIIVRLIKLGAFLFGDSFPSASYLIISVFARMPYIISKKERKEGKRKDEEIWRDEKEKRKTVGGRIKST